MALTTTDSLEKHLGGTPFTTAQTVQIEQWLPQVDSWIKNYLQGVIEPRTVIEYPMGTNSSRMVLKFRPVSSITSIYVDPTRQFSATTLLTANTDYLLKIDQPSGTSRSGIVERISGVWPGTYRRNPGMLTTYLGPSEKVIKVTYVCGYASLPPELELAANIILAAMKHDSKHGAGVMTSEGYEGYVYSLQRPQRYIDLVAEMLQPYRVYHLA